MPSASSKLVIAIAGPTAVGKTELAIRIAQELKTEILSADSRQIYREMTIGTAKPSTEELAQIPHHFINILNVDQPFSAGDYEREALRCIANLHADHDAVVLSGGTGLYHKAVLEGFDHFPNVPSEIRDELDERLKKSGIIALQKELELSDPEYYKEVDLNNHRRLIRALGLIAVTGKPYSDLLKKSKGNRPFRSVKIFLNDQREAVYQRIEDRVDKMIEAGLIEEVRALIPYRQLQALQTVGYSEIFKYFDGDYDLPAAVAKIKQHTRNYAKRQMTWYRNQGGWIEVSPPDLESVIRHIDKLANA